MYSDTVQWYSGTININNQTINGLYSDTNVPDIQSIICLDFAIQFVLSPGFRSVYAYYSTSWVMKKKTGLIDSGIPNSSWFTTLGVR